MTHNALNTSLQSALDEAGAAWKAGDGYAFAALCEEDVDFINLLGMHLNNRIAVAEIHNTIFRGPYAGSTLEIAVDRIRPVGDDAALVVAPMTLRIPSGPVAGTVNTIATILYVRNGGRWSIASFHNTRREATQANHHDVMAQAVR